MQPFDLTIKGALPNDGSALELIRTALTHVKPGDKDTAQMYAVDVLLTDVGSKRVYEMLMHGFGQCYQATELMHGPLGTAADISAWETALDGAVEEWTDALIRKAVGLDAIGEKMHTMLYEPSPLGQPPGPQAFETWARGAATIWAPTIVDRLAKDSGLSNAKLLSAAGITWTQLKDLVVKGGEAQEAAPADAFPSVSQDLALVVGLFESYKQLGATDAATLLSFIPGQVAQQLVDTEAAFRGSALTQMGATGEQVDAFERLYQSKVMLSQILEAVFTDGVPEAAKPANGGDKASGKKVATRRGVEPGEWNGLIQGLVAMRQEKLADLAERLGFTRQTMTNIANGKTGWEPKSPEDVEPLRQEVAELAALVQTALALLDAHRGEGS